MGARAPRRARAAAGGGGLLLVTAHPDDECMFFAPTILSALARGDRVDLLCLSTGDADGLGRVRGRELLAAAAALGLPPARVALVDDARLRDGAGERWDAGAVAEHVGAALAATRAAAVATFDARGVSGHANHTAAGAGAARCLRGGRHPGVRLLLLETTSFVRKYLGPLDVPLSLARAAAGGPRAALGGWAGRAAAARALAAHASQAVWFRRAWVWVSRYAWVNTLVEADVEVGARPAAGAAAAGEAGGGDAAPLLPRRRRRRPSDAAG